MLLGRVTRQIGNNVGSAARPVRGGKRYRSGRRRGAGTAWDHYRWRGNPALHSGVDSVTLDIEAYSRVAPEVERDNG